MGRFVSGYEIAHCRDGGRARDRKGWGRWLQLRIRTQRSGGKNSRQCVSDHIIHTGDMFQRKVGYIQVGETTLHLGADAMLHP